MIRNNMYWAIYIKEVFLLGVDFYSKCLEERVVPAFDNISQEADTVQNETYDKYMSLPGDPDSFDPGDVAESAFNKGLEYYEWMSSMLQATINLFTAGLYHLFEQQLLLFHRQELLNLVEENDLALMKPRIVKERLLEHGIDIEEFTSWLKVDELRLVANTIKHAEGVSAADLKVIRPDLFSRPADELLSKMKAPPGPVFTPLAGDSIFITQEEFAKYSGTLKEFWREMINVLENQ